MKIKILGAILLLCSCSLCSFGQSYNRIISLSGSITEVLDGLKLGPQIIAVDVTSDYPSYIRGLPKVSKNRTVSAETLLSFRPDLILAVAGELSPALLAQLKSMNIRVVLIDQQFTVAGLREFIHQTAAAVGRAAAGMELVKQLDDSLGTVSAVAKSRKKIMFVYARGTGVMSVSGTATAVDAVLQLSGYKNALSGFRGYKVYNTEALVAANPDVILLFDEGLSSLGGAAGLLKMPGVGLTKAGQRKAIVSMDAALLNGFSLRLPEAIRTLQKLIP